MTSTYNHSKVETSCICSSGVLYTYTGEDLCRYLLHLDHIRVIDLHPDDLLKLDLRTYTDEDALRYRDLYITLKERGL